MRKEIDLELSICSAHLFVEPTAHDTSLLEVVPDPCRFVNTTRHYLGFFSHGKPNNKQM